MRIEAVSAKNTNMMGYKNLGEKIIKYDRSSLIDLAEYFHTASEKELNQITGSNPTALALLKKAIDGVVTRKKCYIADGASFCRERAAKLDKKAASRAAKFSIEA